MQKLFAIIFVVSNFLVMQSIILYLSRGEHSYFTSNNIVNYRSTMQFHSPLCHKINSDR
uniref:Uncharacterized protein n=1 Tax=Octopus bimaculoides TaxID=37653 RepID=A0A0L8GB94_OCTBM